MNGEDLTKSLRRTPPHTVGRSFLYFFDAPPPSGFDSQVTVTVVLVTAS